MVTCAVPGCGTTKIDNPQNYTFHTFPKNVELRRKWLTKIHRDNWTPKKYSTVCSKHFKRACFSKRKVKRVKLVTGSIPTLFLPNQSDSTLKPEFEDSLEKRLSRGCLQVKFNGITAPMRNPQRYRSMPPLFSKKKKTLTEKSLEDVAQALSQLASRPKTAMSEFASFGQHVASQLECLPSNTAVVLQEDIQNLITAARLSHLRGEDTDRTTFFSHFSSDSTGASNVGRTLRLH